ncbi:hypothetical protein L218DRAFT_407076 [Marasmius fiardii PR-910]|nr:hypothetical protein L218DRAFT_407076 [Marasmius fiardii PR-910]
MLVGDDSSLEKGSGTQSVLSNCRFSPPTINALPVEVLTDIFRYFQPEAFFLMPDIPPLVHLIRVCKHWRTAALNAPSLWSTIALENPKHFHIAMVRQWLERSKSCPLTLSLTVHVFDGMLGPNVMAARVEMILCILLQHICQWRSISLHFTDFPIRLDSPLLNLPISPTAAPLLEKVDVRHWESFSSESSEAFWRAVGSYPSVRHAVWTEGFKDRKTYLPIVIPVSWAKLTYLASRFILDDTLMTFLSSCETLEVFHILSLHQSNSTLTPRPRVYLPSLQTLASSSSPHALLSQLLALLEVPKLSSLTLDEWRQGNSWTGLLEHSSCHLRTLSVQLHESSEADIQHLLLSPSLVYLEELEAWRLWESGDSLVQTLTWKPETPSLPSLRRLRLYMEDVQDGLISAMLKSRLRKAPRSLDKAHFHLPRGSGAHVDAPFLRSLKASGFDLSYRL